MVHCFLVLCGLPASGKSTLAQKLKTSPELVSKFHIVVLSYDDLMPDSLKEFLTDNSKLSEEGNPTWKKYREDIVDCMDHILSALPEEVKGRPEKVSNELWVNFQNILKSFQNDKNQPEDFSSLIVVDDNMYYRGMRYDFYQMARKYACGFCQIYLRISVQCAITRNQNRSSPIPDQVIEIMASKLEPPCPDTKTWETHSLTIESDTLPDLKSIFAFVQTAQKNPVPPFQDYTDLHQMQERNRRQCSASSIHQVDQILRRLVSEKMASIDANIGALEKKKAACTVREIRMKILSHLKSGELEIPADVENVQDASKNTSSRLKSIFAFVQTAQKNPVPPFQDYTDLHQMQERNRRQCSASSIHQVDQILRRLVSEKMASIDANIGALEKKKAACTVREIRMKILSHLKSGELEIPADVENVQDASKNTSSRLYVWLDGIFKSYG